MNPLFRRLVVTAIAAGLALPTLVMAAPQAGDIWLGHHEAARPAQSATPAVKPRHDMMVRMKALDDRIQALTVDMNMFIGDMKVQAMASLLTAMVERESMMRDEMMSMHRGMMGSMMKMDSMMPRNAPETPREAKPGMCAPPQ